MLPCTDCRPLILDHLYGLLDAAEAAAVEAHLATCPACTAARDEAAKMQGLIAKAAKGAFPAVKFESPVARPSKAARPAAAPRLAVPAPAGSSEARDSRAGSTRRASRVAVWLPWAVAAGVLLAIPGTVVPVMGVLGRAEVTRKDADNSTAKVELAHGALENAKQEAARHRADNDRRLAAAKQGADGVMKNWMNEEKAALQTQEDRHVTWDVLKAATVQPGAPNEFLLVVRDRSRVPSGRVVAEVRDQTDAVLHSQDIDYVHNRDTTVRLPVSVWSKLTPQSELFLTVVNVDDKSEKKTEIQEKVRLLGPVFATVLTTDKPTYRPGETVFFRSLTLDRSTFAPPTREQLFRYELVAPNGHPVRAGVVSGGTELARVERRSGVEDAIEPIRGPDGKPLRGVGAGAIVLPPDAADGDYTLVLRELPHEAGYAPAVPFPVTRALKVRSAATEVYHKQTTFRGAASYSAGDVVEVDAELKLRDKPEAGVEVQAVATADDQPIDVFAAQPTTGPDGKAHLRFKLPAALERGDVRLKVTFKTKAGEETLAERVPVVGRNVVVEFFPEGGDLVAGVQNRVYFRATTPGGVPVDITGVITDGRRAIAEVKTATDPGQPGANRGIGSFTYTPELGTPVWLRLTSPAGAVSPMDAPAALAGVPVVVATRTGFFLPTVQRTGVVMTIPEGSTVTSPGQPISVHLRSVAKTRTLVVGAYTRGRLSDTQTVTAEPGKLTEVKLMGGSDSRGGVVRVTVFEELPEVAGKPKPDLKPIAERLVFRKPGEMLNLDFTTGGTRAGAGGFAPGTAVDLSVTATSGKEKKTPAPAILYAAVVNSAVASDPKDRLLTTHFLIAGEVNTPDSLEYADFLLSDHPKAAETLDLVLGTQGWRRFAEQTPQGYVKRPMAPNTECANLLVYNGQFTTWTEPPSAKQHRRLFDTYWPQYEKAVKKLDAVRADVEAANADRSAEEHIRQLADAAETARREALAQSDRAEAATAPVERFRGAGWYAVAGFGLLALLLGGAALVRPAGRLPLGIGTVGSLGLVAFLVFALGAADRTHAAVQGNDSDTPAPQAKARPGELERGPDPRLWEASGLTKFGVSDTIDDRSKKEEPSRGGPFRTKGAEFNGNVTGAPPGSGFAGGGGVGGFPPKFAQPNPPMIPKLDPKHDKNPDPSAVTAKSSNPPPKPEILAFPNPWFPPFPYQAPQVKLAAPTPAAGILPAGPHPGGGAGFGSPRYSDGGWQPRPPISGDLDEKKVIEAIRGQDVRAMALPAPPPPGAITSGVGNPLPVAPDVKPDLALPQVTRAEDAKYLTDRERAEAEFRSRAVRLWKGVDAELEKRLRELDMADRPTAMGKMTRGDALPSEVLALARIRDAMYTVPPLIVREYAAPRPGSDDRASGRGESDTVLWEPVIVVPESGKTTLTFHVGHAAGGYQVIIAGHTLDGRIGAVRGIVPVAPTVPTEDPSLATPGAVPVPPAPPAPIKP